jgi:hypothetical protein
MKDNLRKVFNYNEITGGLYYAINIGTKIKPGKRFGFVEEKGYIKGNLNKKTYREHRLVWIWHYGDIPENLQIDHINRIKTDNRIENLRLVTHSENNKNRNPYKINKKNINQKTVFDF